MRTTVVLQPYALEALRRDAPCARKLLGDNPPPMAIRKQEPTEIDLAWGKETLRFRVPEKLRPLFVELPGVHVSEKVARMMAEAYERWYVEQHLSWSASVTSCKCVKCAFHP